MIEVNKKDEVYVIIKCDRSQLMELKDYFSVHIPNYKFHPKYRRKLWDGKVSFIDVRTHELPIGLLPLFDKFCKINNYKYKLNFDISELCTPVTREHIEQFTEQLLVTAYTSDNQKIDAYDYQITAVHKALTNKRGIIESCTASGKSLIIYIIIRLLMEKIPDIKILFLVPNTSLVEQIFTDMEDYGWVEINKHVTKLYSGKTPDFKKNVLVSTWQSLYKKQQSFFEKFDVLLCDETQMVKSVMVNDIGKKCINADFRLGFTGSMPKEECERYNIQSVLGLTIFKLKSKELIDRGTLSKIMILNILLKYKEDIIKKNKNRPYVEELNTVYEYNDRNKIFKYLFSKFNDGDNTLILCTQIEHLKQIKQYLEENLDEKYMIVDIYGKTKVSEREHIRKLLEIEKNVVLVGTYSTIGVGFNAKRIHNIIFGSSYKSYVKIIQAIGRGLRISKYKDKLLLIDLIDDLRYTKRTGTIGKNHLYKHFEQRKEYYNENEFKYTTTSYKI